jgi:hypothetical protein
MTGAEALLYFTMQVTQASKDAGLAQPPAVEAIYVNERSVAAPANAVAYIAPWGSKPTIVVMWHALWGYDKDKLRCIARHEVIHVWRKHARIVWPAENARNEADVDRWLRERWNEPAQCGLNKPVSEARSK